MRPPIDTRVAVVALVIIVSLMTGCNSCGRGPQVQTENTVTELAFCAAQPVNPSFMAIDAARIEPAPSGTVQVLVDASGSMAGSSAAIRPLLSAFNQAVSASRGMYLEPTEVRACYFNRAGGIFGCRSGAYPEGNFVARSDTNLNDAVKASAQALLTVIITDGVPASSGGGDDCSRGVDGPCVARELAAAVRPTDRPDQVGGIWLAPVIAPFQGVMYTEAPLPVSAFNPASIRENVEKETGAAASAGQPRVGSAGDLQFSYRGPRSLALLVVARDPRVGRGFLSELYRRTAYAGVSNISVMSEYKNSTSLLPPLEVYPGYVPPASWSSCAAQEDSEGGTTGVGEIDTCRVGANGDIELGCAAKGRNSASFQLEAHSAPNPLRMGVLPILNVSCTSSGNGDPLIEDMKWDHLGASAKVNLACDPGGRKGCGPDAPAIVWTSTADFAKTAEMLASDRAEPHGMLTSVSTDNVAVQPHRIYGLRDMIDSFYRRDLPKANQKFATVKACQP